MLHLDAGRVCRRLIYWIPRALSPSLLRREISWLEFGRLEPPYLLVDVRDWFPRSHALCFEELETSLSSRTQYYSIFRNLDLRCDTPSQHNSVFRHRPLDDVSTTERHFHDEPAWVLLTRSRTSALPSWKLA